MLYTGYSEEFLEKIINLKEAIKLRDELIRKGEVLPATQDIVFKNLMINSHLFLSIILEHFLGIDKEIIRKNMHLENTELPVSNAKEKKKVTDIIVRVERNVVNLEMNASYYEGLINRNIDYILKGKTEANFSGENYDDSYIGIQINFENFSGENYDDSYIGIQINFDLDWQYDDRDIIKFVLMDPERGIVLSENLIIYNINLLKFREKYYNNDELSEFERAITLLTLTKREDIEKISEGVEGLMEAKEEIKKLSNNLGIIGVYDYEKHKEWEWKQKAKEYVKDDLVKIEEGKKFIEENNKILEERKKSLEEGQKSLEEGQKSLEEDKKSFEKDKESLAKRMLDIGLSTSDIIKTTGLSKKQIQELKKS